MNKTVTVNLGGTVFHIDDNAYEALIKYLNAIKSHFSAEQGRDEIMQDIESRIGEMFRDRLKDSRQVITLTDVDEVTLLMGRPEEFGGEMESAKKMLPEANPSSQPLKRRMFRDPDNKLLGGVCGGLAAYFDIDPVWIRLAFAGVFFLWGSGFLLYIILWIILPEAKTTADKLMMKGEPVTVSNIEKNVKEELESVKQKLKESGKSGSVIRRIFEGIGEVFKFIFLFIGKIFAVFLIFIGLVVAFAMFASLFGLAGAPFVHYPGFIDHIFANRAAFGWTYLGVVLVIGIPFLMLAYAGAKMLFNIKKGSRVVRFSALGLWIIGFIIILSTGLKTAKEFSQHDNYRKEIMLQQPSGRYFLLATNETKNGEKDYDHDWYNSNRDNDWDMETINEKLISRNVKLDIVKSPNDSFDLVEIVYARGSSRKEAIDNATKINYGFTQSDSVIHFERNFSMNKDEKWRAQKVQLLLRVPVGGKVRFDQSVQNLIYDIDNVQNIYDADMVDRTWLMTPKGLSCLDCTGNENITHGHLSIHGDNGEEVNVDENGVLIDDHSGNKVSVDSNGVYVRSEGKDVVKIHKHGVHIHGNSEGKGN